MLLYPNKPPEVSDDTESFVHVLEFCALRFHYHSFTDERSWGEKGRDSPNEVLADWVANFFFWDRKRSDMKHAFGGKGKFAAYLEKDKPVWNLVQLTEDRQTIRSTSGFQHLLDKLHNLCCEHYACIDHQKLAPYSDPGNAQVQHLRVNRRLDFSDDLAAESAALLREDPSLADLLGTGDSKPEPTVHPNTNLGVPFATLGGKPASDPLATHDVLNRVLFEAVYSPAYQWEDDKLPVDQFEYLPGIGFIRDKMNTHTFTTEQTWSAASEEYHKKRAAAEANSNQSRKRRKAEGENLEERVAEDENEDEHEYEYHEGFPHAQTTPTKARKAVTDDSGAPLGTVPTTPRASASVAQKSTTVK